MYYLLAVFLKSSALVLSLKKRGDTASLNVFVFPWRLSTQHALGMSLPAHSHSLPLLGDIFSFCAALLRPTEPLLAFYFSCRFSFDSMWVICGTPLWQTGTIQAFPTYTISHCAPLTSVFPRLSSTVFDYQDLLQITSSSSRLLLVPLTNSIALPRFCLFARSLPTTNRHVEINSSQAMPYMVDQDRFHLSAGNDLLPPLLKKEERGSKHGAFLLPPFLLALPCFWCCLYSS